MMFRDRAEAGHELAQRLAHYAGRDDVIVLALPRGGVPVGFELAADLRVPMDLFLVRKLGVPWQPELAMGAVASGGVRVINQEVVRTCGITPDQIERASAEQNAVLEQNEHGLRNDRPAPSLESKIVIIVDDGLATGSTMRAAIAAVRTQHPQRVVVAVPVGAEATCAARWTRWCVSRRRNPSGRWVSGTPISRRSATRKFATCWPGPNVSTMRRKR
jgi:putative phosphoribosyl transferase